MAFDTRLLNGASVLAAIVQTSSFVRASEALGVTSSAISRTVSRLEKRLGVRLFDRTSRAVSLTQEGREFYERVASSLQEIEDAAARIQRAPAAVEGRLRLNVDPWFARFVLAPRLERLMSAHRALQIDLVARDRLGDLVSDGFDAALRFGEPKSSSLVAHPVMRTRITTCAAPSYLRRHGVPKHPNELAEGRHECLLFRNSMTGQPFPWEFHRGDEILTVPVTGRLVANDLATKLAACAGGLGITQTMMLGMAGSIARGELVELFPDWRDETLPLYVYYPSRRFLPPRMRVFLDFVAESLRETGG
ncbi:LysR family transcriptional regulator [Burkholderia plantarii]|nr:LysR family transcriptional regulator [Burkholderia plantarii]WLE63879.1 LysR family transcriptional regulator [Burkholderia plantarii]